MNATTIGPSSLTERFVLTGGSIQGREHARLHRNNQDGIALRATEDLVVAAVTDGCGSGRSSEVGARLGAAWLASWVPHLVGDAPAGSPRLEIGLREVAIGLAGYLGRVGQGLRTDLRAADAIVADFLLFSFLVALVRREDAIVFGIGDGVLSVNGEAHAIDPGPDNAPPYAAYQLIERGTRDRRSAEPVVWWRGPTESIESLLIATDGAGELLTRAGEALPDGGRIDGLRPFETEARFAKNPSLLQKRLVVLGERHRRLGDDTTIALLRRRTNGEGR